ncbi:MAG: N-acetyltransferase family protein [Bacteroidota bacterium]
MIREIQEKDSHRILDIYEMGLDNRKATFETSVPTWNVWKDKFLDHSRFVYQQENKVIGWMALSLVSNRKVFKGVAEVSIYVDSELFL